MDCVKRLEQIQKTKDVYVKFWQDGRIHVGFFEPGAIFGKVFHGKDIEDALTQAEKALTI